MIMVVLLRVEVEPTLLELNMDLLLGKDKDLVFVNGECPIVQERAEVVAQRLTIRLRTLYQEWFLNVDYGVPYLEKILGHKVKKTTVDAIIQEQIYKERGVSEIVSFTSRMVNRDYSCQFRVRTDSGETTSTIII